MIATTVMQMECAGRRIVAISSPGNRTDEQIHHLGVAAAGAAYDHYICCRRDDLRGRGPSEVPERLRDGLLAGGIAAENVSVVPPEEDAVKAALDMARPGDLVVLLYTDHNRTWDLLTAACDK